MRRFPPKCVQSLQYPNRQSARALLLKVATHHTIHTTSWPQLAATETSFHNGNAHFSSASSGVMENTQTFKHTNRTAHVESNLLQSQGCFAIMKRGIWAATTAARRQPAYGRCDMTRRPHRRVGHRRRCLRPSSVAHVVAVSRGGVSCLEGLKWSGESGLTDSLPLLPPSSVLLPLSLLPLSLLPLSPSKEAGKERGNGGAAAAGEAERGRRRRGSFGRGKLSSAHLS